ncbi:hypothetical protein niasHS_001990 [Heterodera schachtii]|uniref:Domain of unknown function DB domain-containing protein n=1 Tax=Heterodera schachtii TaxID=97005 RepID=A0ABD2K6B6_HETSC
MYTNCMAHFVFLAVIFHLSEQVTREKTTPEPVFYEYHLERVPIDRMISEMLDMEKGCTEDTYCFCDFLNDGGRLMTRGMCCGYEYLCRCCNTNPVFAQMPNITLENFKNEACTVKDTYDHKCVRSEEPVPESACCKENYILKHGARLSGEARMFRESRKRSCEQPNEIIIAEPISWRSFRETDNDYDSLCINNTAEFLVPRAKIGQITYAPIDSPISPTTPPPSKAFRVTVPSYAASFTLMLSVLLQFLLSHFYGDE